MTDQINQNIENNTSHINFKIDTFEEFELYNSLSRDIDVDWETIGIHDIKEEQEIIDIEQFSDKEIIRLAKKGDLPDNFIFGFLGSNRSKEMKRKLLRVAASKMGIKHLNYIAINGDKLPMEVRAQVIFSGKLSERVIQYLLKQMTPFELNQLFLFMVAKNNISPEEEQII